MAYWNCNETQRRALALCVRPLLGFFCDRAASSLRQLTVIAEHEHLHRPLDRPGLSLAHEGVDQGAVLVAVGADSPAERANIRKGDISDGRRQSGGMEGGA